MSHFQSPDAAMMSDYTNASGPYLQGNTSSRPSSTAYNGSEGLIGDNRSVASFDYAHDSEGIAVPESARTATRSTAGSRLWSTLSNNAQPAAAALSRKGSVLHSRARSSLAGFSIGKLNNSPDRERTPERQHPNKIFGDIFNGESAPIRLGLPESPTKEPPEFLMEYKPSFTERPSAHRRRSTAQTHISTPSTSRTGWFSRKSTAPSPPRAQALDEILNLDINASLFPNGPADPMSPHAFNDLLVNASNLVQRVQSAYKEKVDYISSVQPEIDAQKEEVEEAETRSRHLKMQLEDMSRKAEEQNQAMKEIADQLAASKLEACNAKEQAGKSVRLVRRTSNDSERSEGEHDVTPKSKRRSGGSQASDSGFESDAEYAESISSGPVSRPEINLTPAYDGGDWEQPLQRPPPTKQSSWTSTGSTAPSGKRSAQGTPWVSVDSLRGENYALRRQVDEMQQALQGCLDFVSVLKR
ncbi:hypothetical protein D0869_10343 [Hortaea werneckii]|uniref:Uncharacterized protein n=2 Tax=Hortaea werneckii TaxID=91943 RepID=A0A3M6WE74_HORWE|nr:hypothetical protein KC324_g6507 [Hortaea werneckii]KAI7575017.1 hypothetical protein KC316_g11253 [Hortaea werneckii]RMX76867.1 hypothetical protein D0869_10343 [Hortaea werneckii]RMX97952.1 hypothetical protein D0868_10370 [Hortaea werneckii]RMY01675.1 hypothetical protein D0867_11310 [Hortaea werneckii]